MTLVSQSLSQDLDLFHHIFIDRGATRTICLLHGTGGDEHDLLPLAEHVAPSFNVLSLRGNVSENGMNRFFRRTAAGLYDQESIATEADKLIRFLKTWCEVSGRGSETIVFLGFSNGANMILASCFLYPAFFQTTVLLHPMLPFDPPQVDLHHLKILATFGKNDPMVSAEMADHTVKTLELFGAEVTIFEHPGGHSISREEVINVKDFLGML